MPDENEHNYQQGEPGNFGLPEGYFERSATSLMNRLDWLEEHKVWPHLQEMKSKTGFSLPEGYFEKKALAIELIPYPRIAGFERKTGWSVPEGYFDEAGIIAFSNMTVAAEPDTSFAPKQLPFVTPDSYFEKNETVLEELLHGKEKKTTPGRVFTMRRLVFAAAAALLLAVFGFRLYDVFFGSSVEEDCGTLACVDRADLLKAKALESLETDELYELVNTGELEKKLEEGKTEGQQKKDSSQGLNADELDELMDGI